MTFTIIIPSYNEGNDVRLSIESALTQTKQPLEILVIDDSSDDTPAIIEEYADRGVRFVNGERTSCCGARNLGMRQARGDVVVLLNADVCLPPDFLEKITKHYEQGADYVLVESRVLNQDKILAAFLQAQDIANYEGRNDLEWTEGFSARRSAVEKVGFIPGDFKVRFCRDWVLGRRLRDGGFKKVIDPSIVVAHKAPGILGEYWRVRVARGRFSALTQFYIYKRSKPALALKFVLKHLICFFLLATVIYPLARATQLSWKSARPIRNVLPFLWAFAVQEVARAVGEWQGISMME